MTSIVLTSHVHDLNYHVNPLRSVDFVPIQRKELYLLEMVVKIKQFICTIKMMKSRNNQSSPAVMPHSPEYFLSIFQFSTFLCLIWLP